MGGGETRGVGSQNAQAECRQRFLQTVNEKTGWNLTDYDFVPACEPPGYPTVLLCTQGKVTYSSKETNLRAARSFLPTAEQVLDAFRTPNPCHVPLEGREVVELVASPAFGGVLYYLMKSDWFFCGDPATTIAGPRNINHTHVYIDAGVFQALKAQYESCM